MDKITLDYYQKNCEQISRMYNSVEPDYLELIENNIKEKHRLLDIGCGSGRDLNWLSNLDMELEIMGLEPSRTMLEGIRRHYPNLMGKIVYGNVLNIPKEISSHKWDIVMSMAVLQHVPEDDIIKAIENIIDLTTTNGKIIISIPIKYPVKDNRDKNNRLFVVRNPDFYIYEFYRVGFKTVVYTESVDSLNRDDVKWGILTFST